MYTLNAANQVSKSSVLPVLTRRWYSLGDTVAVSVVQRSASSSIIVLPTSLSVILILLSIRSASAVT